MNAVLGGNGGERAQEAAVTPGEPIRGALGDSQRQWQTGTDPHAAEQQQSRRFKQLLHAKPARKLPGPLSGRLCTRDQITGEEPMHAPVDPGVVVLVQETGA